MNHHFRVQFLAERWRELIDLLNLDQAAARAVWEQILAAYSESHRHYHNLEHLEEMFEVVSLLEPRASDIVAVKWAVWFHDVVYDPQRSDNEARSVDWARRACSKLGMDDPRQEHIAHIIRATAHLRQPALISADVAIVLDADLAILGSAADRYHRYARDIRREYDWVGDDRYRAGRAKVLQSFLARERIYHTEPLAHTHEAQARANIRAELSGLEAGIPFALLS